jgi:hypothetical protein
MCGENTSSNACVPVAGSNDFMAVTATLKKRVRPPQLSIPHFLCTTFTYPGTCSDFPNTLYQEIRAAGKAMQAKALKATKHLDFNPIRIAKQMTLPINGRTLPINGRTLIFDGEAAHEP